MVKEKSGPERLREIGEEPTLDEFMRRAPTWPPEDDKRLVEVLRKDRARFIGVQEVRRAKREGVELEPGEGQDDGQE